MPKWKKVALAIGVFLGGIVAAMVAIFWGREKASDDVFGLQKKAMKSTKKDLDERDKRKKLEADVVNFKFDNNEEAIQKMREQAVENVKKETENEMPKSNADLAAALLREGKR